MGAEWWDVGDPHSSMPAGIVALAVRVTGASVQCAVAEAPQSTFTVGVDERATSRFADQDSTWANWSDWLGPFILRNSKVKR